MARPRNPGGARNSVGMVDKNGSGVPLRLWTINTKNVVIADTINTDKGMDTYRFLILVRKYSRTFTIIPAKKKV